MLLSIPTLHFWNLYYPRLRQKKGLKFRGGEEVAELTVEAPMRGLTGFQTNGRVEGP